MYFEGEYDDSIFGGSWERVSVLFFKMEFRDFIFYERDGDVVKIVFLLVEVSFSVG